MDVKKYRVHIRRPTRQWRLNKKKQRKKMVVSKVNCEFDFFEIRGNAQGIIDEKREKMIRFQTNTK